MGALEKRSQWGCGKCEGTWKEVGVLKWCKVGEIGGNYSTVLDIFQTKSAKGRKPRKKGKEPGM